MKVVQLNVDCGRGSIGKICVAVSKRLDQSGIENYILYALGKSDLPNAVGYSNKKETKLQSLQAKVLGNWGFTSRVITRRLIAELDRIGPDIVHMHNMHNHNAHMGMLFDYFRRKRIKVFWTFHDCWAFTGYCTYFDLHKCDKWKTECAHCPQQRKYSWFFDRSTAIFRKKEKAMRGVDLTIITPSEWMAGLVKQSFLKDYPVKVINNGIDLEVFRPVESDVRSKFGCDNKYIVLGVAYAWDERKGCDVFIELASRLEAEKYQIIMVGTTDEVDRTLPENIISMHRTQNQQELAALYAAADVYAIPTREDNYPTVNMEALACGTPVVTFRTGGSPEMLDETCGIVVERGDVDAFERAIRDVCERKSIKREDCLKKAKRFGNMECFNAYVELYNE